MQQTAKLMLGGSKPGALHPSYCKHTSAFSSSPPARLPTESESGVRNPSAEHRGRAGQRQRPALRPPLLTGDGRRYEQGAACQRGQAGCCRRHGLRASRSTCGVRNARSSSRFVGRGPHSCGVGGGGMEGQRGDTGGVYSGGAHRATSNGVLMSMCELEISARFQSKTGIALWTRCMDRRDVGHRPSLRRSARPSLRPLSRAW